MTPELKRLLADYDQVVPTYFWKRYQEKILEKRTVVAKSLENASLEDVQEIQGRIKAFDIILRLPSDMTGKED